MPSRIVATIGISICMIAVTNLAAQSTSEITADMLEQQGFQLTSFQTIRDLMQYQISLPVHQELTLRWNSLPGRRQPVTKREAGTIPLSSDFVLVERKRSLPAGAGRILDLLSEDGFVIVAASATGELRGLIVQSDPRMWHGEDLRPGKPPERHDIVFPEVTFTFRLPDDPVISRVVILKPRYSGHWKLDQIGTIQLPNASGK